MPGSNAGEIDMAEQFGSNPWPGMPSTVEQSQDYESPALATLPPHPADAPAQPLSPPRRQRIWPAVLTLFLLAPIVGEVLSGSTPPLGFINPFTFLLETGLYGSGAILVRELVRRRGLGWASILLLGAAYGILEEGLVVTSWFNPYWPDLGVLVHYGRLFDVSWVWAFGVITFFVLLSPLIEFFVLPHTGKNPVGLIVVECLFLLGLVLLSWRIRPGQKQAQAMAA